MKHFLYQALLTIMMLANLISTSATPKFTSGAKYGILNFNAGMRGGVVPGTGTYPIAYNDNATSSTSGYYWSFTEVSSGKFSIKNATNGKYIQYVSPDSRNGAQFTSTLQSDESTLFTFRHMGNNYYNIVSVKNPDQMLYRSSQGSIGCYFTSDETNRQFIFMDEKGITVKDDGNIDVPETNGNGSIYTYLNTFTFNEKPLVYDKREKVYYYSVGNNKMGKDVSLWLNFQPKNPNYTVQVEKKTVDDDSQVVFSNVNANTEYSIRIIVNGTAYNEKLIFTGLPLIQIYTSPGINNTTYTPGSIRVQDPNSLIPEELITAALRHRGATAAGQPKKSYAIKLKDATGVNAIDKSFLGLREDNNWVLDAMAIDPGRMRNRVATDLWNDFSTRPYHADREPDMINGTRGKFVEVFLNDTYNGLYCFTEKVDRKQLKLKKVQESGTVRGVLYKSKNWSYSVFMGHSLGEKPEFMNPVPGYSNKSEMWDQYQVKYPDFRDDLPSWQPNTDFTDWRPLYDVCNFVATGFKTPFEEQVEQRIDFPVFLDYYLFIELLLASDNHGKNMYFYMYNIQESEKLGLAPWDLDGTFGRRWNGEALSASQDFDQFLWAQEHGQHTLFYRLKQDNVKNFNQLTKERYLQLRDNYFDPNKLLDRFVKYHDDFIKSGAAKREDLIWGKNISSDDEINYLREWLYRRTDFLNKQYGVMRPRPTISVVRPEMVVYGDEPFPFSISSTNKETAIEYYLSNNNILSFDGTNMSIIKSGTVNVVAYQAPTDSYGLIDTSFYFKVERKDLIAYTDNRQISMGEAIPAFDIKYKGLVGTDKLADQMNVYPSIRHQVTDSSTPGEYMIEVYGGVTKTNSNYKLAKENGILTIIPPMSESLNKLQLDVYPNPVAEILTVNNLNEGTIVKVYNESGICVISKQAETSTTTIDFRGEPQGKYILVAGDRSSKIIKR